MKGEKGGEKIKLKRAKVNKTKQSKRREMKIGEMFPEFKEAEVVTMKSFLSNYKGMIDSLMRRWGIDYQITDVEREDWVMSDDTLRNLALSEGVEV